MPTTFNVISLGVMPSIDPTEGNTQSENASALVGTTFGGAGDSLVNDFVSFSPGTSGFGGGNTTAYDMNNSASNDQFSIDGGPDQTFDGTAVYNATITYIDGTTATITAVVFQDTAGNTYLSPEFSANADQAVLEAAPIRSLTLDSLVGNNYSGMTGSRETWNYMVCFAAGTRILTPRGEIPVQWLEVGDLVCTADNGDQPIRWISTREVDATGPLAPVRVRRGALGKNLPHRDLLVSPQHRLLNRSKVADRMFGSPEVLIAAQKLTSLGGVRSELDRPTIRYTHFMCDQHEIVFANGMPAETLYLGAEARKSLGPEAMAEILQVFPELAKFDQGPQPARTIPEPKQQKLLVKRLRKNSHAFLQSA